MTGLRLRAREQQPAQAATWELSKSSISHPRLQLTCPCHWRPIRERAPSLSLRQRRRGPIGRRRSRVPSRARQPSLSQGKQFEHVAGEIARGATLNLLAVEDARV